MAKVLTLTQAVKVWIGTIGAVVATILAGHASDTLIDDPSPWARWAAVVLGTLSYVPLILLALWGVSVGDEYQRRIALVGTGVAFVANYLVYTAFGLMVAAHLVPSDAYIPYFPAMVAFWLLGVLIVATYYRLRP